VLRVFYHWCSPRKVRLFLIEQMAILVAFEVAASLACGFGAPTRGAAAIGGLALLCGAFIQTGFYFADLYDLETARDDRREGTRLMRSLGASLLCFSALSLLWPGPRPGVALLVGTAAATGASLLVRLALPGIVGAPERVLVVGEGPRARALCELLGQGVELEIAGLCRPGGEPDAEARRLAAQIVVVAAEPGEGPLRAEPLLRCRMRGLPVLEASVFAERALRRLPIGLLRAEDLVFADGFRLRRADEALKRALDLLAAGLLSVLAAPIVLVAALLIRLESRGPVFYHQERLGRGGRVFKLTKLRTMRVDAEGNGTPVWARQNDDRITRVGRLLRKTRMDELPQLLAVLHGDMSLVGPRPERPYFVEQIKRQVPFYELREAGKPGITGWAQVRYPYGASIDDARAKLEYDLYYLKNRSLFLDLSIIFHTVRHVLMGRGAR
jgi:exopolysaccharide biosynthesis polyprenyl glycosylphosphotransferase